MIFISNNLDYINLIPRESIHMILNCLKLARSINLNIAFELFKKEEYKKRNEFNNNMAKNVLGNNQLPCVNTFCSNEVDDTLFFFLDIFDAIRYTSYHNSKFGNFEATPEYKILELELPDELVLMYLGVGCYEYERKWTYNLTLEVAIPFDEIKKLMTGSLNDGDMVLLNSANIYCKDDINVMKIIEYLRVNPNYKDENYMGIIDSILDILGFQNILGSIYQKALEGKSRIIRGVLQYKMTLLSRFLPDIKKKIEENLSKVREYDIRKK